MEDESRPLGPKVPVLFYTIFAAELVPHQYRPVLSSG